MSSALFVYDEDFSKYQFHPDHPFSPKRLQATYDLLETLGLLPEGSVIRPERPSTELLALAHSPYYIDLVKHLSETGKKTYGTERLGLGTDDNPVFIGMHDAAGLAVGGTLKAAEAVVSGRASRALNLAGGLHHAGQGHASGFCIYNDLVVAIRWIRRETGWRVLYLETDAHHGDGVQDAFYSDPNVFVLSLHEAGQYLFPGTGDVTEVGMGAGRGTTLNVPLAPATDDESWLEAFRYVVPRVMRKFKPDIVVSQHGCDGHYWDPLADLCATTRFYEAVPRLLGQWVQEYACGRWIATGGGGYQALSVVPRVWALLWGIMAGFPLDSDTAIPDAWLDVWQPASASLLPRQLYDRDDQFHPIRDRHRVVKTNRETLAHLSEVFSPWNFDSAAPLDTID